MLEPIKYPKLIQKECIIGVITETYFQISYADELILRTYEGKTFQYAYNGVIYTGKYITKVIDDLVCECIEVEDNSHLTAGESIYIYDTVAITKDNELPTLQDIHDLMQSSAPEGLKLANKVQTFDNLGKGGLMTGIDKAKIDRSRLFLQDDTEIQLNSETTTEIVYLKYQINTIYGLKIESGAKIFDGLIQFTTDGIFINCRACSFLEADNLQLKAKKFNYSVPFVVLELKSTINYAIKYGVSITSLDDITLPTLTDEEVNETIPTTFTFNSEEYLRLDNNLLYATTETVSRMLTPSNLTAATVLDADITILVDGLAAGYGEVVKKNTTFSDCMRQLLTKTFYPTYVNSKITLSKSGIDTSVEVGTIRNLVLTVTTNQGSILGALIDGLWNTTAIQNTRSGLPTNYTINGVDNTAADNPKILTVTNCQIMEGTNTFSAETIYAEGPQPVNSQNNSCDSPYREISRSASTKLYGRRNLFYDTSDTDTPIAITTNEEVRALTNKILNPANGTAFNFVIPTGATLVTFAYPASLGELSSVLYVEGMNADITGIFTLSTIDVKGANAYAAVTYNVYTYIPASAFESEVNYTVTI